MYKYIGKRILLMFFTLFIVVLLCFMLIRALPTSPPEGTSSAQSQAILERWDALGYNKPLLSQFVIYLKNIFTKFDFGTSWKISKTEGAFELLKNRLTPTVLINLYALILSVPLGLLLGVIAAIKKNRWQDHLISTTVMFFVSVPSYIYAFVVQYIFFFKLGLFPQTIYSLSDAGGWFTGKMFYSMVLPVLSLSFGQIAGLCRFTRAELTENLNSDYMLLARAKGLTHRQATVRHALKNALVPILPMIISSFIGILTGSLVIESIFSIPGVGQLYVQSVTQRDYDVFMLCSIFYTLTGLLAGIVVDISYGFIDPRIKMGER